MSRMRLEWTEDAVESFKSINEFVAGNWGDELALSLRKSIDFALNKLLTFPEMGYIFLNLRFRKLTIHKYVSIYYTIRSNQIKIIFFWDNWQDPKRLLDILGL